MESDRSKSPSWQATVWPAVFSSTGSVASSQLYLADPAARKVVEFFERKGIAALKQEDQQEQWYDDWLAYQAEHKLYASVLSPRAYSSAGAQIDLLRYARFFEVISYCSPSHAYSLQVSFLGLFSILMGVNEALKKEAVAALEQGGQFAFGVSEKQHGSDLFGNEFTLRPTGPGRFVANGSKYYIGNANCASIIAILARKGEQSPSNHRNPFVLFALRPTKSPAFGKLQKIRTIGVKAAFVGSFDVREHELPESDLLTEGRGAWDAVVGTVTIGKFFLGFATMGVCEHAFDEATRHLATRILYGKPVLDMPHIRSATARACARLMAMKLYAYRALDYVQAATAEDRRYLLFCAVQKAMVSTEAVKVVAQLSQCIGAKGFEAADTFFEMALRDVQLIPLLESSAHINLAFTAQFAGRYFGHSLTSLAEPLSLAAGEIAPAENEYLTQARSNALNAITFPPFHRAYAPLRKVANVRLFMSQAGAFRYFLRAVRSKKDLLTRISLPLGQCVATIAYGQLIAENAVRLNLPREIVSTVFHLLVADLSEAAQSLAATPGIDAVSRFLLRRLIAIPRTSQAAWDFVSAGIQSSL